MKMAPFFLSLLFLSFTVDAEEIGNEAANGSVDGSAEKPRVSCAQESDRPWLVCDTFVIDGTIVPANQLSKEQAELVHKAFPREVFKSHNLLNGLVYYFASADEEVPKYHIKLESGAFEFGENGNFRIDGGRYFKVFAEQSSSFTYLKVPNFEYNLVSKAHYSNLRGVMNDYFSVLFPMFHSQSSDHRFIRYFGIRTAWGSRNLDENLDLENGFMLDFSLARGSTKLLALSSKEEAVPSMHAQASVDFYFRLFDDNYLGIFSRWDAFTAEEWSDNARDGLLQGVLLINENELYLSKNLPYFAGILSFRVGYNFIYKENFKYFPSSAAINTTGPLLTHQVFVGFTF